MLRIARISASFSKKVRTLKTSAVSFQRGLRVTFPSQKSTSLDITSPLQTLISSLAACQTATIKIIAKKKGFAVGKIHFHRIESTYNLDNFWQREGKDNLIGDLYLDLQIETNLQESKKQQIREMTERLCPIYQIVKGAGVKIHSNWKLKPLN